MKKILFLPIIFFALASITNAQTIEDALRYANPNGIITPRSAGLGVAYHGIADDYAALFFNPAGLSLVTKSEFNFGFGYMNNNATTDYQNILKDFRAGSGYISNIGLVSPVGLRHDKAAIAVGYFYESNYNSTHEFDVYNPNNSMIGFETATGPQVAANAENWAYELYLADKNAETETYFTDYDKEMHQTIFTQQTGGMHNISGGIGFDLNQNIALGFSIIGKFGEFNHYQEYTEADAQNKHNTPVDGYELDKLIVEEYYNSAITGISGKIGVQGRIGDFFRIGVAVQLPTWYEFTEDFDKTYTANYVGGGSRSWSPYGAVSNEPLSTTYSLVTPFVYSGGVSVKTLGVVFSAGVEYSDATQLDYSNSNADLEYVNRDIVKTLAPQTKWGFGAEWDLPIIPISVRAGVESTTSPYASDNISNANLMSISGGASMFLGKSVRLDAVVRWSDVDEMRNVYGWKEIAQYSYYIVENAPLNVAVGLAYRF